MSKGAVNQVIQRAIGDAAFRRQLSSDPKKALAGFDLSQDETAAITSGDAGRLAAMGVDQRTSKMFGLGAMSAASKSGVSPDLSGASTSAFVDEGGSAGRASAIDTGGDSANTANLRRIEGDLNVSAAREAGDVSGDFNAFDPGIVSNTASAVVDGAQSAHATNLRRIEGDLNVAAARQPIDASGDFNALDPGIETTTSEATAFEPSGSGLDLSAIDPGYVSGGDAAARTTDVANDAGGLRPNEPTE